MRKLSVGLGFLMVGFLFALTPLAQVGPRLYDVSGVANDDVLNVREEPSASSAKVGKLSHNARNIEVISLSDRGKWGLVNAGERAGWVSMRFMKPSTAMRDLPVGLSCSGTEPFWFMDFPDARSGKADWSAMGLTEAESLYGVLWYDRPANRTTPSYGFRMEQDLTGSDINVSGIIRTEICSDGMSDREYGFSVDVILTGRQPMFISGCCNISAD